MCLLLICWLSYLSPPPFLIEFYTPTGHIARCPSRPLSRLARIIFVAFCVRTVLLCAPADGDKSFCCCLLRESGTHRTLTCRNHSRLNRVCCWYTFAPFDNGLFHRIRPMSAVQLVIESWIQKKMGIMVSKRQAKDGGGEMCYQTRIRWDRAEGA